jgi:hypothetical protein
VALYPGVTYISREGFRAHTGFIYCYQWWVGVFFLAFIPLETENDELKLWISREICPGKKKNVVLVREA